MNNTFGDEITKIRIAKKMTLRSISLKLKNISLTKYSKIERGIQNPRNKDEFLEIIDALGLVDPSVISKLEELAMKKIYSKKNKLEDKEFPLFTTGNIKTEKEAEDFLNKYNKIIKDSEEPE